MRSTRREEGLGRKLLTIAGSGPSCEDYNQSVTVATKKRPLPSEYIFCRFPFQYKGKGEPLMCYYKRGEHPKARFAQEIWFAGSAKWDAYWSDFVRSKYPPQRMKPSLGMCAVFGVVERWQPKEIGLIGFDHIMNGNTDWEHDALAEKRCIESLVKIIDLRSG